MNIRRQIVFAALLFTAFAANAQPKWVGSWGASPQPPSPGAGPFPATPSFNDQTVRQIVRLSVGGERVRLRLSNEYGTKPITIGAARVAIADGAGLKGGTERAVTFDGKPSAVIAAGAPLLSDPIDLAVGDLATLSVSVYLQGDTGPCTCHGTGMQDAYISAKGDFTKGTFAPAQTTQMRAFLSGVEVLAAKRAGARGVRRFDQRRRGLHRGRESPLARSPGRAPERAPRRHALWRREPRHQRQPGVERRRRRERARALRPRRAVRAGREPRDRVRRRERPGARLRQARGTARGDHAEARHHAHSRRDGRGPIGS